MKEKNKMPDILDYAFATHDLVPLTNNGFRILSDLNYGHSEEIYLTLGVECITASGNTLNSLGTFKTLEMGNEAMHTAMQSIGE